MSTMQFAPWQKVQVTSEDGLVSELVVYTSGDGYYHHVHDIKNDRLTSVGGPHLHGAYDYNLDDSDNLCFGCASCTEWNCQERGCYKDQSLEPLYNENGKRVLEPFCIHIQAVIAFLKKKEELENQNIEFEEYSGRWVSYFDITKKKDKEA